MDLDRWLSTFRAPLVGLLASWGAPWRDAEELAQDTFAEAFLSFERFRGGRDDSRAVGAWLRGIAFRLHAEWRRNRARSGAPLEERYAVDDPLDGDDRVEALRAAIDRLPGKLRTVVWMRYLDECRVRDVADLLGDTEKVVENRLREARRELRRILTERALTADGRTRE